MATTFNADEILEIAEQIERNGARFYREAAAGIEEPDSKKSLLDLAKMEDFHEETFREMRSALAKTNAIAALLDPDSEAALYLQAFAGAHVFDPSADPVDFLEGGKSVADILKKAIGLEKDSVVFYLGIKQMVPAELGRDKIEEIIQQEMKHIALLSKKLGAL